MSAAEAWTGPGALLAFDTATAATVVGAAGPDGRIAVRRHDPEAGAGAPGTRAARPRPGHVRAVLPLAVEALGELGLGAAQVGRVAVGLGPGSFTGLRAGIATARGLALGTGAELVGVPTLRALAAQGAGAAPGRPVLALLDGRRGELFVREPGASDDDGRRVRLTDLEDLLAALPADVVAVGDGALVLAAAAALAAAGVPLAGAHAGRLEAGALVACGAAAAPAGASGVVPVYGREPDAVPSRNR